MNPRRSFRIRLSWPLLLVITSIIATGVAVFEAQRLTRSHRETARRLVRDYTAIAAWNYQRHASAALHEAIIDVLQPVMHFQMHGWLHQGSPVDAQWFVDHYLNPTSAHYLDDGRALPRYLPDTFLGFTLGADTIGVRGRGLDGSRARAVLDTLNVHVRRVHRTPWDVGVVSLGPRHEHLRVAYTLMPTTLRDTAVYAFVIDPVVFDPVFRGVYRDAQLLPAALTAGHPNEQILDIALADVSGAILFESARHHHVSVHGADTLPVQYGGLTAVATIRSDAEGLLIIGGLPRSRLPFVFGLLVIALALALVGIGQLRRESALASQRADFVSSVSHELRTPLAQIRLFLETVKLGRFSSAAQRDWLLENIDRETARLANLVENLLLFSRLEHGGPRGTPEPVDLAAEIRQIVFDFEPLASARRAGVRTRFEDDVVAAVQRGPFRQLMLNLLDNAVKYGPAGQTVVVRMERRAGEAGPVAWIAVEDAGPGVPVAERERIWQPFQRGARAAADNIAGGGIGLSIVREVVELHGGSARIEAAERGGARFVVELPAEPAAVQERNASPESEDARSRATASAVS